MSRSVPMVDLKAQYRRIKPEIDAAIQGVVESTQFVRGEKCREFEAAFAEYCGVDHACGVANGTDALTLALRALGVERGDEVITVANTFIATGEAILLNEATPIFVDVDPATFTMDPDKLEAAFTPRTKVIIPVHLYGHPAAMRAICEVAEAHGVKVLEDAAQAHGASIGGRRAGALGFAATFSFYPGKNLGAYGDAGMVVSGDADFIDKVRQVANHGGGKNKYDNQVLGTNSRLDTLQAAVLLAKLSHLDEWTDERRERVAAYSRALASHPGVDCPQEADGARSAWHLYTIRCKDRESLEERLKAEGISTAVHYPRPLHLQPALSRFGGKPGDLPVTEKLCSEVLSLPLYPELPLEVLEEVAAIVASFCEAPVAG